MPDASLALDGALLREHQEEGICASSRIRALVDAHFDFVWRLLRRLGVPESEVDDAAQYVFVVAAQRIESIPLGNERAFLYGTATRVAWRIRRDFARRARWMGPEAEEPAGTEPGPEQELVRREALALLDEVLEGLEPKLREVFVLSEIEGLTAPEIAVTQAVPIGTVASRLRRARKDFGDRLRKLQAKRSRET